MKLFNWMLNKNGNERNKNPKGQASFKSTSLSGFGEKKLYIENLPGGVFLFQGEFSLYKIIPWGMNFYIENFRGGRFSTKKTTRRECFLYRKPSGGTILCGGCFSLSYLRGCCNDVDCFGCRPFPAVFRADFLGGMISAIMIWGSRNINIAKFIFLFKKLHKDK